MVAAAAVAVAVAAVVVTAAVKPDLTARSNLKPKGKLAKSPLRLFSFIAEENRRKTIPSASTSNGRRQVWLDAAKTAHPASSQTRLLKSSAIHYKTKFLRLSGPGIGSRSEPRIARIDSRKGSKYVGGKRSDSRPFDTRPP